VLTPGDHQPSISWPLHGNLVHTDAHKAFLVTSAWFGPRSYSYVDGNRIDLWSGRELRQKLLEYLDRDYFIGHDKLPPGWHPHDIA
jgi:hypothetical protein